MADATHANYPDERGAGSHYAPISKHLAARQAAQWCATWGAEMAELEARRAAERRETPQK